MTKTTECKARVVAHRMLEIPAEAWNALGLQPNEEVALVLQSEDRPSMNGQGDADSDRRRWEAWQAILDMRKQFEGMNTDLTEHLILARREDDPDD